MYPAIGKNQEIINTLNDYGEEKYIEMILSEHPEVRLLWRRRNLLPDTPLEINGINPIAHVLFESIVENQAQEGNPPEVLEAIERLKTAGFSHHSARANVAGVFIPGFYDCLKEKRPFDGEAYARRLKILGKAVGKLGRNDLCPCGSGKKFKKCCLDAKECFELHPNAGLLILGQGSYADYGYLEKQHPGDAVVQLENRSHIADFLESEGDLEGAELALKENIELAESLDDKGLLKNSLEELQLLCLKHEELIPEAIKATGRLIEIADSNEERCLLWCDKADLMARQGRVGPAEKEYGRLFSEYPDWHFGRYRYALLLDELGNTGGAVELLKSLLAEKDKLDEETCDSAEDLLSSILEDGCQEDRLVAEDGEERDS